MSTQPNPAVEAAAKTFIASVKDQFVSAEAFKEFREKQEKANADLLQGILDAKKAPAFAQRAGKWNVRNQFTREVRDMEYSLARITYIGAYKRAHGGYPAEKEFEHEVEYCKRAVSEGTSSAGGTLIPQEWTDFVIPELGAQVVVMRAGPNVLPMQHQVLNIPGLTNNQTCSWIGENGSISESNPTTNNTPLTLHTAASFTGVSIQWLRDATPETDAALQANLVRGLARFVDNGYLNGTGSSNQPTGLANVSSISQIYAGLGLVNGSTILYDDFDNAIFQHENANTPRAGRAWIMHPRTISEVRRLKDTLGRPLFIDNLKQENYVGQAADPTALFRGADGFILGYPVFTTTAVPTNLSRGTASTCSYVLLVAFSDIYVGQGVKSQGMEVAISDQALFQNAEIAVRLLYRTDIQPGHAVSICSIGGVL